MTEQERNFRELYEELMSITGYQVTPKVVSKHLSQSVLELACDLQVAIEPIPNWQPPPEVEDVPVKPDKTTKSKN